MLDASDLVVTTGYSPSPAIEADAAALADRLGRPFVVRRTDTIHVLTRREEVAAALVVDGGQIRLVHRRRSYRFHPSMSRLRISSLLQGREDRLVDASDLRTGDRLLDCTCGLGADAIVASHVVGETGAVLAVEASAVLAALAVHGMQHYDDGLGPLTCAMRRVTVVNATCADVLTDSADGSWDVVYFDPMFESTIDAATGLDVVRLFASVAVPDPTVLAEARRVARRCVVVKDRARGHLLETLGLPVVSRAKTIRYGRLDADRGRRDA